MKKTIKNYCLNATQYKLDKLYEIARRIRASKNDIFARYGSVNGLQYLQYPRAIRDDWVKTKYAKHFNLPARYWKMAFDEAFVNIKSKWSNVLLNVKAKLMHNKTFTPDEKHYAFYILCSYSLLYRALNFMTFDLPDIFKDKDLNTQKVHQYLKSRIRTAFGKKPYQHKDKTFYIDSCMYDVFKDTKDRLWLGIMSLKKRNRIHLLLTSAEEPKKGSNLKIVLKSNRIEIHHAADVPSIKTQNSNVIAIDKGFSEVIVTSSNNAYGIGFNELLKQESDRLSDKNKRRNKLRSLAKKYEEKEDFVKAELIKANNLGRQKYNHQKDVNKEKIINFINKALKEFLKKEKPSVLVEENLNFTNWSKKLSKKVKRYFSFWLKGYMKKRIEYLCKLNGVELSVVNAAYTSQVCHLCGSFGKREGDKFYCETHGVMDADYNATRNTLARYCDNEITLYTPYQKVKAILQERLRLSNQDSRNLLTGQSESESTLDHI